ncbi:ATP-binding protein [Nitrospirillum iridis]|uniref:Putative ATPase/DNA-binding winged helix-turn-helix (WHTH) protein n=1 Tax=Nitrospirillum iridis TaxID=765888 RepID=A0A7X0AZ82_9PROT|nr:winged helix-turn-helix domain-containing protein [Nitrospirillum iridis]MBB6252071.1 putative ATPase/DNA-binding winged helix-turn-helix (wHTH) protein [Nitrospirillum iridis]
MDQGVRYTFGAFTFDVPQLTLTKGGLPVKLGGRAANLLAVLAAAGGELVTRDRLLAEVWPGQSIDESAVRVHLSGLRKALGDDGLVVNEAGRGYRLTLPVSRVSPIQAQVPEAPVRLVVESPTPRPLVRLLGRSDIVAALADELPDRRFLTLAGPGGIGKTSVALATVAELARRQATMVRFVDFAPVSDAAWVEGTLATVLGLPASGADRFAAIAATLGATTSNTTPTLLLLDNCEHLVDAVADLAERLLSAVPDLMILATSREPLRAAGEWVHRLPALPTPDERAQDAAAVLAYPAAALFHERARAVRADFAVDDATAPALAEICRRLDGIPLAIELAAARVDLMDLTELAGRLHDRLNLLTRGRRTALPRHRTLRAALDWSYELLAPNEKTLLIRLSVFRAGFDAADAQGVTGGDEIDVLDGLADLVAKSLVVSSREPGGMRYRLLDTTRHYGHERLADSGLDRSVRAAHARHMISLFGDAQAAWEGKAPRDWLAIHSRRIDDIRGALDWAVGEEGDVGLGLGLMVASASLWFHLSLAHEFLGRAERVLAVLDQGGTADPAQRVELLAAYGHALWHTRGPVPEMAQAFQRALAIAEDIRDEGLARRALWGLWAHRILAGGYAESLALAEAFTDRIGPGAGLADRQTALHMRALSHHFMGDHAPALELLQAVIAADADPVRVNHANHAQVDGKVAALSLLMRLQWQMGDVGGALDLARLCAEDAVGTDHALSICYGLAIGCIPVAIAAGETALAGAWIDLLAQRTTRHALDHWHAFVHGYGRVLGRPGAPPADISAMQEEMFAVAGCPLARARVAARPDPTAGWHGPWLRGLA